MVLPNEHVFWFDIAVDDALSMRILQSVGDLFDVGDDRFEGETRSFGMPMAQVATHSVVHDQERGILLDVVVEDAHDMGVFEMGYGQGEDFEWERLEGENKAQRNAFLKGYEQWYTSVLQLIKMYLPEKTKEFAKAYEGDAKTEGVVNYLLLEGKGTVID